MTRTAGIIIGIPAFASQRVGGKWKRRVGDNLLSVFPEGGPVLQLAWYVESSLP